ncbi:MAG TPA: nucleotidyltransferase domain-containing protein [Thermoanaerobaculia bacterium]|jgi:predicted nucleotidyltransferase|nr:nucleotidyltransferase domain-containing protein [Thermoanaerobaculia bacterium]
MGGALQKSARTATARTSIADALLTKTQQRVLLLFFGQPDRSFFKQELIDRAGSGSGAVQRELARLVDSGLVTVSRIGSQKHYQANRTAPVFEDLRGIVTKTIGLADPLRAALRPLAKRIELALVYGSVAKGNDRAQSDIDLLVVGDDLTLEDLFARLGPVEKKVGRTINPTLYTHEEFARRRSGNAFLQKVLREEHIVLIGTENGADESR